MLSGAQNIVRHVVDDPQTHLWGGPFAEEGVTAALARLVPDTQRVLSACSGSCAPTHARLARSGIVLAGGHTSAPVCMPSRWSLLSGRYASAGTTR